MLEVSHFDNGPEIQCMSLLAVCNIWFCIVLHTYSASGTELDGGKACQDSYVATMLPECACGER